jgi:hypothetical protein
MFFKPNRPAYGKQSRKTIEKASEILVYDVKMDIEGITSNGPLPYML